MQRALGPLCIYRYILCCHAVALSLGKKGARRRGCREVIDTLHAAGLLLCFSRAAGRCGKRAFHGSYEVRRIMRALVCRLATGQYIWDLRICGISLGSACIRTAMIDSSLGGFKIASTRNLSRVAYVALYLTRVADAFLVLITQKTPDSLCGLEMPLKFSNSFLFCFYSSYSGKKNQQAKVKTMHDANFVRRLWVDIIRPAGKTSLNLSSELFQVLRRAMPTVKCPKSGVTINLTLRDL